MSKKMLNLKQIKSLISGMRGVYRCINTINAKLNVPAKISKVKTPTNLSESLVLYLLREGELLTHLASMSYRFGHGNIEPDIVGESEQKKLAIEVKGTTDSEFIYLGKKDKRADYLIWVNYGDMFTNRKTTFTVHLVSNMNDLRWDKDRIKLDQLRSLSGKMSNFEFDLNQFHA